MSDEMTFSQFQARHREWAYRNFGGPTGDPAKDDAKATHTFMGAVEEMGELSHALLKQAQGIRGTHAEHEAAAKDAVGDVILYLADLCSRRGWDLDRIITETTDEVWSRDWVKGKQDGRS